MQHGRHDAMVARESGAQMGPSTTRKAGFLMLFAIIGLSLVGNSAMVIRPMVVGGLVDILRFTERQAGFVASAELGGFASGSLVLVAFVHRLSRRYVGLAGLTVVLAANLMACVVSTFGPMLLVRFAAGVGSALAYSGFIAIAAAQARPERVFSIVNATSLVYTGVFIWIAPQILCELARS